MASFFKTLFRKENDSQPVPAAFFSSAEEGHGNMPAFLESGDASRHGELAGGLGAPFFENTQTHLTARELAALLPPTLLRFDGVSPEQVVVLPMKTLRETMQTGRPAVLLSQIHAACPLLFQRELQPGEDKEVTLPIARVKGLLEAEPAPERGGAFAASTNPFAGAARQRGASAAIPMQSPFAPPPESEARPSRQTSPFAAAAASPFAPSSTSAANAGSPFAAAASAQAASPFAAVAPVGAPPVLPMTPPNPMASPFASMSQRPASPFPPANAANPPSSPTPFTLASLPASRINTPPSAQNSTPPEILQPDQEQLPAIFVERSAPTASPFSTPFQSRGASGSVPFFPVKEATSLLALAPEGAPPSIAASRTSAPASSPFFQSSPPPNQVAWPAPAPASGSSVLPPSAPLPEQPAPTSGPAIPQPAFVTPGPGIPSAPGPVFPGMTSPASASEKPSIAFPVAPPSPLPVLPPSLQPASPPAATIPPLVDSPATVTLGLRATLRDAESFQLGFDPINVPESVRLTLPLEVISSQLASGRVELSVAEVCSGIAEKFRPAFARASADCRIVVPMSEVFHNLPESARPGLAPGAAATDHHRSITTSPFQTPFAIKAEEDRSLTPPPLHLPTLRPAATVSPTPNILEPEAPDLPLTGILSRPPGSGTSEAQAGRAPRIKPFASSPIGLRPFPRPESPLMDFGAAMPGTSPPVAHDFPLPVDPTPTAVQAAPSGAEVDDLGESHSAASLSNEPPPRAGSAPVPFPVPAFPPPPAAGTAPTPEALPPPLPAWPPAFLQSPVVHAAPVSLPVEALTAPPVKTTPVEPALPIISALAAPAARVSPATAPVVLAEDLTFGCISDSSQLTLRAVLGTDQTLTLQDIVDRCADLPGLKAAVLFSADQCLISQGTNLSEAAAFQASARKTRESLVSLAESMGLGPGGNFTLRTDHGVRSFFLESSHCLAVWHTQPFFTPGTREKLILITQQIAKVSA